MRVTWILALIVSLAACDRSIADDTVGVPDAALSTNCDGSAFTFVAPRPELHYDPNLIVVADMFSFYAENVPGVEAIDDLDRGYEPTGAPTSRPLDNGLVEMRWPLTLAPGRRYTLYFWATECDQKVEFFTSSP